MHTRSLLNCMNLAEAVELLRVVSAIPVRDSAKHSEIRIIHTIGEVNAEDYTLRVKKNNADADYRNHLDRIAESNKLAIRESELYLILCSH
jgi:hypothetical protein